jgi:hypothetical protein
MDEWSSSPIVMDEDEVVIHYTPHYLYAPSVPFDMHHFYPEYTGIRENAKFIVILRNPIERSLSSYWFRNSHLFTSNHKDSGSMKDFEKIVEKELHYRQRYEKCMNVHFHDVMMKKYNVCRAGNSTSMNILNLIMMNFTSITIKQKKKWIAIRQEARNLLFNGLQVCFGSQFRSSTLGKRHIDKSIYFDQLDRWFLNFPIHNFYITSLEKFAQDPQHEFSKIMHFIGADVKRNIETNVIESVSSKPNVDMSQEAPMTRLRKPNSIAQYDLPSPRLRNDLEDFFAPYNRLLKQRIMIMRQREKEEKSSKMVV